MLKRYFAIFLALVVGASCLVACEKDESDVLGNYTSAPTVESGASGETDLIDTTELPAVTGDVTDKATTAATGGIETPTPAATEESTAEVDADGTSAATSAPAPTPAAKTYVWVICESLYVRDNQVLAEGNKLGVVSYGTRFEVLEKAAAYTKVVYNGGSAYISAKAEYVSFTEPPKETPTAEPTQPAKTYVWVVNSALNIRDNPVLAQGNILDTASKGDSFEVIERADTYTKIVYNGGVAYISAKSEYVTFVDPNVTLTEHEKEVIRKIMYAVETGGQVYGRADYADFTEAFTNTPIEYAITIGAGQWYANEAKRLLNLIRATDPALFAQLDTAGIAYDLDNADWSTYDIKKTSAKAKCIQTIIDTAVGHACQDQLIVEQMITYMAKAKSLGVTDIDALMMCANIHHLGGLGAMKRILEKTAQPYTLDNIYAALQTDTVPNQVGTFKSRHKMVYESLKKYL